MGYFDNVLNQLGSQTQGAQSNGVNNFWGMGPTIQGLGSQIGSQSLYDPSAISSMQQTLNPLFQQQFGYLNRARANAASQGANTAGSYAAAHNMNPLNYVNSQTQRVNETFAPQFDQLQQSQMGTLLNSTAQSQQFNRQGLQSQAGLDQGLLNSMLQKWTFGEQMGAQPNFGDYLGSGLMTAAGSFLGGPGGGALGASLFGAASGGK